MAEPMTLSSYMRSYKDMFSNNNPIASIKPENALSEPEEEKSEQENKIEPPADCPCRFKKLLEDGGKSEEKKSEFNLDDFSNQTGFLEFPNIGNSFNTFDLSGLSFNAGFPSYFSGNQFGSSFGYGGFF